ncbi:MAG: DUF3048 domain-containing protein [Anaerolineae bacterium]|nr:DUF3048 domain-containing protein [Anaerolineae bacterium]MCB9106995.1 DUF3048 domain-containing protein [Anaerolineales bacterium]
MRDNLILLTLLLSLGWMTACSSSPVDGDGVVSLAAGLTPTVELEPIATQAPTVSADNKLTTGPTVALPTVTRTPTAPPKPTPTATQVKAKTPSPTPTKTTKSSPTPQVYVIEQFDTLFDVALKFDTSVDAIMEANDLTEDDLLQIGQELIIPQPGQALVEAELDEAEAEVALEGTDEATADSEVEAEVDEVADVTDEEPATAPVVEAAPVLPTATPVTVPGVAFAPAPELGANINPLTGLPVDDPAKLTVRPLMVRIGNDPGARKAQKGLNSADIVYEEITEWWVTRLTAIFLGNTPEVVGPIRSVRLVNIQEVPQYQGALAHSGGSDPVRWEVSQSAIEANLDEFYNPAPYFYHENESWETRLSINTKAARDYLKANNLEKTVSLPPFFFSETSSGEPGEDIYIPYPGSSFTEWHYDAGKGKYLRWINGVIMRDTLSGQVAASNVIVYFSDHQRTDIVEDSTGATSVRIIVNGAGRAWFFRDGKLTKGYWQTDGTRPPYFSTEDGEPYALKPGNTWIQLVPVDYVIGLNSADEASR